MLIKIIVSSFFSFFFHSSFLPFICEHKLNHKTLIDSTNQHFNLFVNFTLNNNNVFLFYCNLNITFISILEDFCFDSDSEDLNRLGEWLNNNPVFIEQDREREQFIMVLILFIIIFCYYFLLLLFFYNSFLPEHFQYKFN